MTIIVTYQKELVGIALNGNAPKYYRKERAVKIMNKILNKINKQI